MKKKPPKFMICKNELVNPGEIFILHTQKPVFVAWLNKNYTGKGEDKEFIIYLLENFDSSGDNYYKFEGLMNRLKDWYISYTRKNPIL